MLQSIVRLEETTHIKSTTKLLIFSTLDLTVVHHQSEVEEDPRSRCQDSSCAEPAELEWGESLDHQQEPSLQHPRPETWRRLLP